MRLFNFIKISIPILIVFLIAECAEEELFSNSTKTEYNLTSEDLRFVQFYITTDVRLIRTETNKEVGVTTSNRLNSEESILKKEIDLDKATKGAAFKVYTNKLTVAFDRNLFLDFGPKNTSPETPYSLVGINGHKVYESGDTVKYRGENYCVIFNVLPMLDYKFTSNFQERKEQEEVKGMTVEDMLKFEAQIKNGTNSNTENKNSKINSDSIKTVKPPVFYPVEQRPKVTIETKDNGTSYQVYLWGETKKYYWFAPSPTWNSVLKILKSKVILYK